MTQIKKNPNINFPEKKMDIYLNKIYEPNLKSLLYACYQCARCTGVCQLSKFQDFKPSRIIQKILEGFEKEILKSGILWSCLTCNSCLADCPEEINFAEIVRIAKYKMVNQFKQNPQQYVAHKGIYTMISEIMCKPSLKPERNLDWAPNDCNIAQKGKILYHVGCLPYFKFEFEGLDNIPKKTLQLLSNIEEEPIVILKDELCCGHDLYWGQGNIKAFIKLAEKNLRNFESAEVSTIITTCAEGYRTFKIEYPKLFDRFNEKFEIKHIIEYIYDKWKEGIIEFNLPGELKTPFNVTFHDPCRLSRFLPNSNRLMEKVREIIFALKKFNVQFEEMEHSKKKSLCCGVSSWMNCNERSKAIRYKRLLEAKKVGKTLVTACPKCIMHFKCLQNDYEDISTLDIRDFTEFIHQFITIKPIQKNRVDDD